MKKDIADYHLQKISESCRKNNIPRINQTTGELLSVLTTIIKPSHILEIGTGGGYSTFFLACRLDYHYSFATIEKNKKVYKIAKKNIENTPLSKQIKLVNSDAIKWLKYTKHKFDFIFVDGKKREYGNYFALCKPILTPEGVIVFDDTLFWKNKKHKSTRDSNLKGIYALLLEKKLKKYLQSFNKKLLANPEYKVFTIPIDNGLTIAIKH